MRSLNIITDDPRFPAYWLDARVRVDRSGLFLQQEGAATSSVSISMRVPASYWQRLNEVAYMLLPSFDRRRNERRDAKKVSSIAISANIRRVDLA
jgi:hypothetical protein